jgi:cytochrome c oxidase subunit 2
VPVGRPVKLLMTSRDVIHSFYVPAFRIKQDVIPGRYVTAWFEATAPGNYDIYCAEYCGVSHSRMLGTVTVLSQPDYDAWLAHAEASDTLPDEDFAIAGGTGAAANSDLALLGRAVVARAASASRATPSAASATSDRPGAGSTGRPSRSRAVA